MDAWVEIRRKARACHEEALLIARGDRRAASLVKAVLSKFDLELRYLDFAPGTLGSLDRSARLVNVAKNQEAADETVVIVHEVGHFLLHRDPHSEVTVRQRGLGGDPIDSGAGKVEGYSPKERKEVQADVFAGEFLCPSDWLREAYVVHNRRPQDIAAELGLPVALVTSQMARALLLPPLRRAREVQPVADFDLDDSQALAATWDKGPLLIDAGPGTGKTRTLVHRIKHLLASGSSPGTILALTFSNKAAEEMRERLSAVNADAAIEMWVGTFHAFGLELLRRWPSSIRRTGKLRILDQTDSLALLESRLESLPLHHFQNLYEPAYELVKILRAISRCKDELISCGEYQQAADAAQASARSEKEREDAEKVQEIAKVYRIYEQALEDSDSVDFGDLVKLAVELVQNNPDVKKYVSGFGHVLVDEYQDVNAASTALLRAICDGGADVWVVADQRQSIYRFRGAEPLNVGRFISLFGGQRHALANNYRSYAPIVRTFESFSREMGKSGIPGSWKAARGTGGNVTVTVAPTVAAEGESIAQKIGQLRHHGVAHEDQAIVARTHLTLARITGILEQLGIPLLYLGDLFERPEIRDLLSLVGLGAEFGDVGLARVAALPEYQVPKDDALKLGKWARDNQLTLHEALTRCGDVPGLSDSGQMGLSKLGQQLKGLEWASPLSLLTTWLFERSSYLGTFLQNGDAKAQQQLVAIYHLLKVCGECAAEGNPNRKRFLERIRRIEVLNEDTPYRMVSSEAADMDAVRVMTIHGSKGLEFRAVHFPALATGYTPGNWRGAQVPAPPSLPRLTMSEEGHHAEEECLYFVGLSRAQDHLSLSRAEQYTSRKSGQSKFLTSIAGSVPVVEFAGTGKRYGVESMLHPPPPQRSYREQDIDLYMQCPARYEYAVIDGLHGSRTDSAYLRFHRAVYATIRWLEEGREAGRAADRTNALSHLSEVWAAEGPIGHAFEMFYRSTAESMVIRIADVISSEQGRYEREEWSIPIGARQVLFTPDRVWIGTDGTVHVQRIRTGRQTKTEMSKPIYALMRRGASLKYPGRRCSVEVLYLATNERISVPVQNDDKLIAQYADAVRSIERGDFSPERDARRCPNCPFYFTCRG